METYSTLFSPGEELPKVGKKLANTELMVTEIVTLNWHVQEYLIVYFRAKEL